MYFIHGGRATGKTSTLVIQSAMTGVPIMTTNYQRVTLYKDYAKNMGLKIPEPIIWKNRQEGAGLDKRQVLIDDGENFLNYILIHTSGVRCVGMAIGEPVFELDNFRLADSEQGKTINVRKPTNFNVYMYGEFKEGESEV